MWLLKLLLFNAVFTVALPNALTESYFQPVFFMILSALQRLIMLELDKGALSNSISLRLAPQQCFKDFIHIIHTGGLDQALSLKDYSASLMITHNLIANKLFCPSSHAN